MPINSNIPRCTHIKLAGHRCGSPARDGEQFCHFHTRVKDADKIRTGAAISIVLLEDADSVQAALMQVIDLMLKDQIDLPKARLILRAIELASRNLKNLQVGRAEPAAKETKAEVEDRAVEPSGDPVIESRAEAQDQTREPEPPTVASPPSDDDASSEICPQIYAVAEDAPQRSAPRQSLIWLHDTTRGAAGLSHTRHGAATRT